ncbi:MAG TPA: hypothetical protein ENH82_06970, partial [bacterium]|nr:hypothetical protein [bacterium]
YNFMMTPICPSAAGLPGVSPHALIRGNYYTTKFMDAWDVAVKTIPDLPQLEKETVDFVKEICESTLPQSIKEAALNNVSTLRTQTCFRIPDGHFFGFEGTHDDKGCCFGSCTHVWNYETATAFLFPRLARTMRDMELQYSTHESGSIAFRTKLPLIKACGETPGRPAADGQMGVIMKLYREWHISGDNRFLKEMWPYAKKALAYAWLPGSWDADQDGVMEGVQHNTYDVEFFGPNPMMSVWYLGALWCAEEMAHAMGDGEFAVKCRTLYERGSKWIDDNLFNGEYYIQIIKPASDPEQVPKEHLYGIASSDPLNPDFQVGTGCLIDQLVGQYMAHIVGIGHLLDPVHVKKAAGSIYQYNFKADLYNHFNNMRTFALNDESAVLICSWPRGGRPKVPFIYFNEVMTGFEYQAAALMMYENMIDEGINVVNAIRSRYDGKKRNPWDEAECGHHYARAMASWSTLLALSGFHFSAVDQSIMFNPKVHENDFKTFWCAGNARGTYNQNTGNNGLNTIIAVNYGSVELKNISLGLPEMTKSIKKADVKAGDRKVSNRLKISDGIAEVTLKKPVKLKENEKLTITLY